MAKSAKQINPKDNVATLLADCASGEEVTVNMDGKVSNYACLEDTSYGHKIALVEIAKGEPIVKYGETIGSATKDIKVGEWVHIHNVRDDYLCLDKYGKPLPGQSL